MLLLLAAAVSMPWWVGEATAEHTEGLAEEGVEEGCGAWTTTPAIEFGVCRVSLGVCT
ncbi:MAG: hypothetical protein O3A95_03390 [Planctomycetota bacterium]|nr:hypothetical protein [Planctomycetota bacterium]